MWYMPVLLTETENENDSVNQNGVAKMTLQKWRCKNDVAMSHGDSCCTLQILYYLCVLGVAQVPGNKSVLSCI